MEPISTLTWSPEVAIDEEQMFSDDMRGVCGQFVSAMTKQSLPAGGSQGKVRVTIKLPAGISSSAFALVPCKPIKNEMSVIGSMVGVRGPPIGYKAVDDFGSRVKTHVQMQLAIGHYQLAKYFFEQVCQTEAIHSSELSTVHDYAEEAHKLFAKVGISVDSADDGGDSLRHFFKPDAVYKHPTSGACLYIGGQGPASNLQVLEELQIFNIINCQGRTGDLYFKKDKRFKYLRYGISEDLQISKLRTPKDVYDFLAPCHDFIDQSLASGQNIMVHCLAGAHRAGTAGVSYMMRAGKMPYVDAVTVAKQLRPCVDPMGHLEELLLKLEWAQAMTAARQLEASGQSCQSLTMTVDYKHNRVDFEFDK